MFGVDVLDLVRINQEKWGRGLTRNSRLYEGTALVLPHGVSAQAVAAAASRRATQRPSTTRKSSKSKPTASSPTSDVKAAEVTYVAAENQTPKRCSAFD